MSVNKPTPALKPRIPAIVTAALIWTLVVDIPTGIGLGPLSLSGAATLGVAAVLVLYSLALMATRSRATPPLGLSKRLEPFLPERFDHNTLPVPLALFAMFVVAMLALEPGIEGVQNVAVYVIFIAAIPITGARCSVGTAEWAMHSFRTVAILVGSITVLQSLTGVEIYGPRSAALTLVVLVGVALALPKSNWLDRALPILLVAASALTLSRTALFVAAILIPVSMLFTAKRGALIKMLAMIVPMYYLMYLLVTRWAPLKDRFLEGDNAYSIGGLDLNTSGRSVLWEMTITSWQQAPMLGHGPGTASAMISARFPRISHPHNEYLRILHDFGLVGLTLFVVGFVMLLWMVGRRATKRGEPVHRAAALGLIGVAAVAITDNVLIYPFVMLPVAVLVGLSMAHPLAKASDGNTNRHSERMGARA